MHPILLLIVLVGLMAFISWYKRAPSAQQKTVRKKALIFGGLGLVLVLLLTGRLHPLFAAAAAMIPVVQRVLALTQIANTLKGFRNTFKSTQGPTPNQTSNIETQWLRMYLDHESGEMRGEVLSGRYAGRNLRDLGMEQLLELLGECRASDAQSAAVLEAYLDRIHGQAWREGDTDREDGSPAGAVGSGHMTKEQAYQVLGLAPGARPEEVVAAHRHLMQKLHPDRGGSTFLAAQINQAKDVLLED